MKVILIFSYYIILVSLFRNCLVLKIKLKYNGKLVAAIMLIKLNYFEVTRNYFKFYILAKSKNNARFN